MSATISVPLHIKPTDMSPDSCMARVLLHQRMAALNPDGFRSPRRTRRLKGASVRGGHRDKRSIEPSYRMDSIALLASLAGREQQVEKVKQSIAEKTHE